MSGSCRAKPSMIIRTSGILVGAPTVRRVACAPCPAPEPDPAPRGATVAYTDGACRGNPGPGGWAWAVPGGRWESGYDPATTNQRMEIMAACRAVQALDGPVHIVSDSTYVVNCFRDEWWKGWIAAGLEELQEGAGRQPRPVGAVRRAGPSAGRDLRLGEGPLG